MREALLLPDTVTTRLTSAVRGLSRRAYGDAPSEEYARQGRARGERYEGHRRSRRRVALYLLTGLIGLCATGFFGFHLYLQFAEWRDPSGRVYVSADGTRVYLEQPWAVVTPREQPASTQTGTTGDAPGRVVTATPTTTPTIQSSPAPIGVAQNISGPTPPATSTSEPVPLPPLHLQIPLIDVDVPVVLSDSDNLPRIPVAGWFFKSAFPATAGNTVIIGHVNGEAAIFQRLGELKAGDEIRIVTERTVHVYTVESTRIVRADETDVLRPTDESVVTLITCTGDWLPQTRTFTHRLVVRGYYAALEPLT